MECEKGKGDKEWREQKWEEGIIYKINLWNCWVTGRVKLQTSSLSPSVSSSPTSPHTKTHSLSPPHPTATVTTKHSLPHTQSKRMMGAGKRMRHIVTLLLPCGIVIDSAFVIRTHESKPDRSKQKKQSTYLNLKQQIGGLAVRGSISGCVFGIRSWYVFDAQYPHKWASHCCRFQ